MIWGEKHMGRLVHALGNVVLTILVIILIIYGWAFIEIKLLLKSQPELFGYVFYQEKTEDMEPNIEKNEIVIVKKDTEFASGDIILYFDGKDSKYKAQYVVSTNDEKTVTRDKDEKNISEPISNNNIVGKAVGKVAFVDKIIAFFKQKTVLISIGVIGVLLLVVSQYMEFKPKNKTSI